MVESSVPFGEFATREAISVMAKYWPLLPNPDPVLKAMRQDISVYRKLMSDPIVAGLRRRRCAAVRNFDLRFRPSAARQSTEMLSACALLLRDLSVRKLVETFIDAAFYGYQVAELVAEEDGAPGAFSVRAKPREWFGFGQKGELRFMKQSVPAGDAVEPHRFIVVGNNRSWDCPYGEADLAACFWPVTFKAAGTRWWMQFAEKFGMPWCIGKLPREAPQAEVEALATRLAEMVGDAVAVIPDDGSISLLGADREMNGEGFERLVNFCRSEIAIAILGTDQAVEVSESAGAAKGPLADLAISDAQMVASGIDQVLREFCRLRFPGEHAPATEFFNRSQRESVLSARDQLLQQAGCRFTPKYFSRQYGLLPFDLADTQ